MADSIIKDIYNDIKNELTSITEIASKVDLYKNQIASLTSFPFALIDFPYVYYKDASARIQLGNALVKVILCMDVSDLSGASVTDIFELKDKVYSKLQGVRKQTNPPYPADDKPKYSPLTRGTERTVLTYTGVYVFEMDFYTTIQDDGVYVLKNYIEKNNVELDLPKGNVRGAVPADEGRIGLIIDHLENDHNNEIRTGKNV